MDPLTALVLVVIFFGGTCTICLTIHKGRKYSRDRISNLEKRVSSIEIGVKGADSKWEYLIDKIHKLEYKPPPEPGVEEIRQKVKAIDYNEHVNRERIIILEKMLKEEDLSEQNRISPTED